MSDQEQEQTEEYTPFESLEGQPDEQPTPLQPPDEEEEADEQEQQESDQVEGVPAEPEGLSQKQLEAAFSKLERERERHDKRIADIMGDDKDLLLTCPLCDPLTPGQIMPTPATPERFPAVREFMGDAQPAEYEQDPNVHMCQSCAGQGMVATGSKVQGQEQLVCTDCGGKGWQGQRAPIPTSGPMAVQPQPEGNGVAEVTPQGPEPPEAAKLRAMGYTLIQPVGA